MIKCIYCLKEKEEEVFNQEHVIPKMLGRFDECILEKLVCAKCNNKFSKLETLLQEDSMEGLYSAIYRIVDRSHVRLRLNNLKIKVVGDFLGNVFEKIFPQAILPSGKIQPRSMLLINNKQTGFNIFWLDKLNSINPLSKRGRKIVKFIVGLEKKGLHCIVDQSDFTLEQAYKIISDYGVNFQERKRESFDELYKEDEKPIFQFKITETVPQNSFVPRIIAKTAFNYFSFNAIKSNLAEVLYYNNFDDIRNFILNGEGNEKNNLCFPLKQPILHEERQEGQNYFGHTLTFEANNTHVIAKVSLFGMRAFRINLGQYPFRFLSDKFGGGHFFNPLPGNKYITELSPIKYKLLKSENQYGLYRR